MNAKCPCQTCNTHLEFDSTDAGQSVTCPNCGADTVLFVPPVQNLAKPKPAPAPQSKPKTAQDRAGDHLKFIRANSCYALLRSIINVCAFLTGAGAVLSCLGLILENVSVALSPIVQLISVIGMLAGMALAIVLTLALRQLAFLLIDIADLLLHRPAANND